MMGYFNLLSFASGYYHIDHKTCIVTLSDDMPPEMRERFWKVWPAYWEKVMKMAKDFNFVSSYPVLPYMEEDPNKAQYENL